MVPIGLLLITSHESLATSNRQIRLGLAALLTFLAIFIIIMIFLTRRPVSEEEEENPSEQ